MKSGCVSDSTRAAGRRLAEAYQTALANFGSQARHPSPCGVHPKTETEKIGKIGKIGTRVPVPLFNLPPISPSPTVAKIALTSAPRWHHIIIKQLIDEESYARYP